MDHVVSADGTRIAFKKSGTGPPLVLVHGIASDHSRWAPLSRYLEKYFTLYAIDRRGRGLSGDSPEYEFEREIEDVVTVAHSIAGPVNFYGHSGGALYSLEAAPRVATLRRMVLYEPAIPNGAEIVPNSLVEEVERLIDAGDPEAAVMTFMRQLLGMPDSDIENFRSQPSWPARVAAAPTLPREMRTANAYSFAPEKFNDLAVPTLLLTGSESPRVFRNAIETVHAALPNSRVHELPGQMHSADALVPEQVADSLIEFLLN